MNWVMNIGCEVHARLNTQCKLFSQTGAYYGHEPNTLVSYIDAALPGTLPVLNEAVIDKAILFGLSVQADIDHQPYFARKNYFYPDLPKGYQISQSDRPIIANGHLDIKDKNGDAKTIDIERAHLEEDAGKSIHDLLGDSSCIDLNRAGVPLLEIVSAPQLHLSLIHI